MGNFGAIRICWITRCYEARSRSHSQDSESDVILVTDQSNILPHPIDFGVGYVDPVQDSKDEQQTEDGDDLEVDPPHQRRLVDVWVHLLRGELSGSFVSEVYDLPISGWIWGPQSW